MELYHFLLVLPIIFLIIRLLSRKTSHRKLPPGPAGFPILGSLPHLGPRVHESLFQMAKRHGPLMSLRLGAVPAIVASSPEAAQEILGKNEQLFSARPVPYAIAAQPGPEFTLAWGPMGSSWRNRRRTANTHLFSPQSLSSLEHLRQKKVQELLRHIERKHLDTGKPVNIGNVAFATILNMVSNTLFSADVIDPEFENAQEFKDAMWQIIEAGAKPNLGDYFPSLQRFDLQGIKKQIRDAYGRLHELVEEIIEKRMKDRAPGSTVRYGDFLDALLDLCQDEGSGYDSQNIRPFLLDLFIAGSETTSVAIEWAMAELLRNPSMLQKAREEVLTVVGSERPVEEADTDKLPYLQAIVKETLRLHPGGPLLHRYKSETDIEVFGYTIPKGIHILINAWAIARDPNHWIEPTKFHPERFTGSSVDYKGRHFEFIPFGAGRRMCPGVPLAGRMFPFMVASLIQSFNWSLPGEVSPEEMDMEEKFGVTLKKATPLYAIPSLK